MKIQRSNLPDSGALCKSYKPSKKSKGTKKSLDKILKNPNSSDSQESLPKQNSTNHLNKKTQNREKFSPRKLPDPKPQVEKRKPETSERKILRKVDRQRLETVLEEGYISNEEVVPTHTFPELMKCGSSSGTEHGIPEVSSIRTYKSWIHSLMSFSELSAGASKADENSKKNKKEPQSDQMVKSQLRCDKEAVIELTELKNEPKQSYSRDFSPSKRGVILSGMMEILPIFSNDKFYCSRDAISLEDPEDADIDKNASRFIPDAKKVDVKPLTPVNSANKEDEFDEKFVDILGDVRDTPEKKTSYKVFSEKSVSQQTSSPFINSLLVLTPFANEKEESNEKKVGDNAAKNTFFASEAFSSDLAEEGKYWLPLKIGFGLVMSIACLLVTLLSVAWISYKPPCIVDFILEALPFVHYRRSYIHIFFDKLLHFLSNILGDQSIKFSICDHNFEFTVF